VPEIPDDVQRWTAKRRVALVVSILKGETSVAEAARRHGLTVAEIEDWQERLVLGAENALRTRPKTTRRSRTSRLRSCSGRSASSSWTSTSCGRRRRAALRIRRCPASE
jgi:transposase-like protein